MKNEIILEKLELELFEGITYFQTDSFFGNGFAIDTKTKKEITIFFEQLKDQDLDIIFKEVDEKYGSFLTYYRETKRNNNINIIRRISMYFLVISIISIIIGIIYWIILSQNSY